PGTLHRTGRERGSTPAARAHRPGRERGGCANSFIWRRPRLALRLLLERRQPDGEGAFIVRIRSWKTAVLGLALTVLVATGLLSSQSLDVGAVAHGGDAEVARGQYVANIMDCAGCHTPGALAGQPEADRPLAGAGLGVAPPRG